MFDVSGVCLGDAWWKGPAADGMECQAVRDTAWRQQVSCLRQSSTTKLFCGRNADCAAAAATVYDMQVRRREADTPIFYDWKTDELWFLGL